MRPSTHPQSERSPTGHPSPAELRRRARRTAGALRWALLASSVLSILLGIFTMRRPPPMNYTAFEATSTNPGDRVVAGAKPRDVLVPVTMKIPRPAPRAADADEALRRGSPNAALSMYQEALLHSDRDAYSRAMATCLLLDRGDLPAARETFVPLRRRFSSLRSVRLLDALLSACHAQPSIALADAWLQALSSCASDGNFQRLHPLDRLADTIDARVHDRPPPGSPPSGHGEHAQALALLERDPSRAVAREVLMHGASSIPLKILALSALRSVPDASVRDEVATTLQWLSEFEPENAYWEYLLAARASPHLFVPGSSFDDDLRGPSRATVDHALRALRKREFDSHAIEVHALVLEAERRRVWTFAELRTPLPHELTFLGDRHFLQRLTETALQGAPLGARQFEPLAAAVLRLLDDGQSLHVDPFSPFEEHRRRLTQMLWDAAGALDLDPGLLAPPLEQRRPSPHLPFALRVMQRYTLRPLPVPRLVREFRERYAVDPAAVALDLIRRAR